MARRGTPIPFAMREDVKRRAGLGESRRSIMAALGLAKRTVDKYAKRAVATST